MAKKVVLVDDMEDTEVEADAGTFHLSLNGRSVDLDLSTKSATRLEALLSPYFSRGRAAGKQRKSGTAAPGVKASRPTGSGLSKDQMDAVRHWARTQGMQVSDRGRISSDIRKAYEEAHASSGLFSTG